MNQQVGQETDDRAMRHSGPPMLPSLAGSHAFRTLSRHTLGIVTHPRTGHGYFGEWYQTRTYESQLLVHAAQNS